MLRIQGNKRDPHDLWWSPAMSSASRTLSPPRRAADLREGRVIGIGVKDCEHPRTTREYAIRKGQAVSWV